MEVWCAGRKADPLYIALCAILISSFHSISSALDFKDHLQKTTKKLGVGLKRKVWESSQGCHGAAGRGWCCVLTPSFPPPQLCFALSMLGSPRVTLLDEPSTGMDPKAKQRMW